MNLEDISAPRCFEIEKKLKECCDIPIFHDDQHGTAVITLAGHAQCFEADRKEDRRYQDSYLRSRRSGDRYHQTVDARWELKNVIMYRPKLARSTKDVRGSESDQRGDGRDHECRTVKKEPLAEVIKGADVFIGVSAPGTDDKGNGSVYGFRSDHFRLRKSDTGDLPG